MEDPQMHNLIFWPNKASVLCGRIRLEQVFVGAHDINFPHALFFFLCITINKEHPIRAAVLKQPRPSLTQVSDVPQRFQCGVFIMKHNQHRRSGHTSGHWAAVDVVPETETDQCLIKSVISPLQIFVLISTWSSPPSISPALWWWSVFSTRWCQPQRLQG